MLWNREFRHGVRRECEAHRPLRGTYWWRLADIWHMGLTYALHRLGGSVGNAQLRNASIYTFLIRSLHNY